MANNYTENFSGFSLIEILVVIGILSLLITGAFFIGFPEYKKYLIYSERDYLIDTLLESRARSLVGGVSFTVGVWSNGYCIKDVSNLCVVPFHNLPPNMVLINTNFATSTKMTITFSDIPADSALKAEINIDQHGSIIE